MYICKIHGELDTEWCDDCGIIIECDHSETDYEYTDVSYHCDNGLRSKNVYISFCKTCGEFFEISTV